MERFNYNRNLNGQPNQDLLLSDPQQVMSVPQPQPQLTPVPTMTPVEPEATVNPQPSLTPVPSMIPVDDTENLEPAPTGTPIGKQAEEQYEEIGNETQVPTSGGMRQTKSTNTVSKSATTKMAPHSKEQILKAHKTVSDFSNKVAELRAQIGDAKANKVEEAYNNYAQNVSQGFEDFERVFGNIQKDLGNVDKSLEDISRKKIDPNRYLANMTNTERMVNALAAGLEAGWNHLVKDPSLRKDYFQTRIEKAIQMDIALQEKELTQAKDYQTGRANLLRDKLKDFDSLAKAKTALSLDMLKIAEGKILGWAEGANAKILPEEAQLITSENALKIAEKQAEMITSSFSSNTVDKIEPPKADENKNLQGSVQSEYVVPMKNGKYAVMLSKEDASATRASIGTVEEVKGLLDRVLEIRDSMGPMDSLAGVIGTEMNEKVALLKGLQSNIAGKLAQIKGLGALTGPDLELVIDETGLLTSWGKNVSAKVNEMKTRLDREVESKLSTGVYGFVDKNQVLLPGIKP